MDWEGGRSVQDMERALFPSPEPGGEADSKTPAAVQGQGGGMRQGHGIQDSVHNENERPLLQKLSRISGCNRKVLNKAWSPSQGMVPCICTGHMPMKLALYRAQAGGCGVMAAG